MSPIRFAAVGHVTNDRLETGIFPGGAALYAGLAAAQMGARVRIITSCAPDFVGADLIARAGIEFDALPSRWTTSFEAVSSPPGRRWKVRRQATSLARPVIGSDVVFACPVLTEVEPSVFAKGGAGLFGAGLQGWLRSLDENSVVQPCFPEDLSFLSGCKVVFCSDEDLGKDARLRVPALGEVAEMAVITQGDQGALLGCRGVWHRVRACPAREVDPTGAGDTFGACFLVALASGHSPMEAAVIAACAASVAVEAVGPAALSALSVRLPERMGWYRENVPAPQEISAAEVAAAIGNRRAI